MTALMVGQEAPAFRLPSAQGSELGPEDYRGRSNLIVWFTKGMGCAFCRQHMSQLARGYPEFKARGAELLEVTPTPPARAQFYARNFRIPFPYLCDPDYRAYRAYGLGARAHSLVWYAQAFYMGMKLPKPPNDFGPAGPALREFPDLLKDTDMGFFVLDRDGIVRYALAGSYIAPPGPTPPMTPGTTAAPINPSRPIPTNEEIFKALDACERR